jgi:hypothetical protein
VTSPILNSLHTSPISRTVTEWIDKYDTERRRYSHHGRQPNRTQEARTVSGFSQGEWPACHLTGPLLLAATIDLNTHAVYDGARTVDQILV